MHSCFDQAYEKFADASESFRVQIPREVADMYTKVKLDAYSTFYHAELITEISTTKNKGQLLTNLNALKGKIAKIGLDFSNFDDELQAKVAQCLQVGVKGSDSRK